MFPSQGQLPQSSRDPLYLPLTLPDPTDPVPPPGAVFAEAPFQDGYDLTIGTSERGSDVASAQLPSFRRVLLSTGTGPHSTGG